MAQSFSPSGPHALVFGPSGLGGWDVVDQLLSNHPTQGTFSKVTALVKRPLSVAESCWPSPSSSRPSLDLISGVNLRRATIEEFAASLKERVAGIDSVTHTFYFAYKQEDDADKEVEINITMLGRAIGALNALSPKLQFVVFPSCTKVSKSMSQQQSAASTRM